jgi:adenosylhomocysteinase
MARTRLPPNDIADLGLATGGVSRIAWAGEQMPVLARIRERFASERPLAGIGVGACLHVTAETAQLLLALTAGGARVALCSANPLSTQDDVAAALVYEHGVEVRALRGEDADTYARHVRAVLDEKPEVTVDDGADLLMTAHALGARRSRR